MKKVIYSKFSNERDKRFNIRTDILCDENGNKYVVKAPTGEESKKHITNLLILEEKLSEKFSDSIFVPNKARKDEVGVEFEFLHGQALSEILDGYISQKNYEELFASIEQYVSEIQKVYGNRNFEKSPEFINVFGDVTLPEDLLGDTYIDIDIIFANVIVQNNRWNVIDYEWTFDFCIPVNFLIYRALRYYIFLVEDRRSILGDDIFKKYEISEAEIAAYDEMERNFQAYVYGKHESLVEIDKKIGKRKIGLDEVMHTIHEKDALYTAQVYFDKGTGFCEEHSYYVGAEPDSHGKISIDVEISHDVEIARIDPAQKDCVIEIVEFYSDKNKDCKVSYTTNGYMLNNRICVFDTVDPQIIITDYTGKDVHLEYYIYSRESLLVSGMEEVVNKQIEEKQKMMDQINRLKEEASHERQMLIESHSEERKKIIDQYDTEKSRREELERILIDSNRMIEEQRLTIQHLNNINAQIQSTVDAMQNSTSWKLTKPVRFIGKLARKIAFIRCIGKHVKLFLRLGWGKYWKAVEYSRAVRKGEILFHEDTVIADVQETGESNAVIMNSISLLEECDKKIAVHVHLYYEDLLPEILGYLSNIPYAFDVFISCREDANENSIATRVKKLEFVNNVVVKKLPNRGRDIAPLYVWFAKDIANYDYFLHIHTKKSLYTGSERQGWRQYSLNSLVGSRGIVKKIFWLFENEERVGLVYPDNHEEVPMQAFMWLANEGKGREFLNKINVPFEDGIFMYPTGSFFWARKDAIKKLFDINLSIEDFDEEAGQTDGTLAHVIERATGLIAKNENYRSAIIDYREGVVRWDLSLKAFRPYLDTTADDVKNFLMQYDVISFDIFDTLLTRGILHPDDLFELMRLKVKSMFSLDLDFLKLRKEAEWEVNKRKGAYTNIHDIYEEFEKVAGVSHEVAQQIKQLEIDLEYNLILPRCDMREIYNGLKAAGKHVILVSDMYLTSSIIKGLLQKCGYDECDDMWVSCECGLRKDQDNIWDAVLEKYEGKRFIHVGDNSRSDWQTLVDRRKEAYWIMSAATEWKLSPYYEKFRAYDNGEIINSLLLGMTINGGMFNSPFVLNRNAQPEMRNGRNWGASVFGPLFYKFSMWLDKEVPDDGIIAFLAREGYILEPIYLKIMEGLGKEPKRHHYLLTSRRAVTVAGIKDWNDVRDIIGKMYKGSISNMLKARLGIDMPDGVMDKNIILYEDTPDVIDEVMDIVKLQSKQLFEHVKKEKDAYLKYINELIPNKDWDKITVVDVGYSGTIQYYLAKLLEEKVGGRYLAIFGERKPAKLGCECEGLYNPETDFNKVLHPTQLFLEAVLQAPMGQLIKLTETENGIIPEHKPDENVDKDIVELQNGILEYCKMLAVALKNTEQDILTTGNLVEDIYTELVNGKMMSQELGDIFTVEDDYCSNGVLKFNKEMNCWM